MVHVHRQRPDVQRRRVRGIVEDGTFRRRGHQPRRPPRLRPDEPGRVHRERERTAPEHEGSAPAMVVASGGEDASVGGDASTAGGDAATPGGVSTSSAGRLGVRADHRARDRSRSRDTDL